MTLVELQAVLTNIGDIVSAVFGWFVNVLNLYMTNEVLIIPFGIFIVGAVIGLVSRITHR